MKKDLELNYKIYLILVYLLFGFLLDPCGFRPLAVTVRTRAIKKIKSQTFIVPNKFPCQGKLMNVLYRPGRIYSLLQSTLNT